MAFQVSYTGDNNTTAPNYANGINYFTSSSSTGSLRSAINYAQTWMNGASTSPRSIAIILTTCYNYNYISSNSISNQGIVFSVPSGMQLTVVGTGGQSVTVQGMSARVFKVTNSGSVVL
ncbi:MAG: hypothetical protein ACKO85_04485, partial [Isosphaeraceae bacterium]